MPQIIVILLTHC